MKTYWNVVWSIYVSIVVGVAWHLACTPTTPDGGGDVDAEPVLRESNYGQSGGVDRPAVRILYHDTKWFVEVQPGSGDFLMYKPYYNGRMLVGAWWEEIQDTSVVEGPKIIVNPPPDGEPRKTATKKKR